MVPRIWDTDALQCVRILNGHSLPVSALALNDKFLVSGSDDATMRLWDWQSLLGMRWDILFGKDLKQMRLRIWAGVSPGMNL